MPGCDLPCVPQSFFNLNLQTAMDGSRRARVCARLFQGQRRPQICAWMHSSSTGTAAISDKTFRNRLSLPRTAGGNDGSVSDGGFCEAKSNSVRQNGAGQAIPHPQVLELLRNLFDLPAGAVRHNHWSLRSALLSAIHTKLAALLGSPVPLYCAT